MVCFSFQFPLKSFQMCGLKAVILSCQFYYCNNVAIAVCVQSHDPRLYISSNISAAVTFTICKNKVKSNGGKFEKFQFFFSTYRAIRSHWRIGIAFIVMHLVINLTILIKNDFLISSFCSCLDNVSSYNLAFYLKPFIKL